MPTPSSTTKSTSPTTVSPIALEAEGLDPTRSAFDLATAFSAEAGSAGPNIAVLLEYDALPGIGHACGHNIIAAAGLGAGLAAAAVAAEAGGRVRILGSPAEEGGGGKVLMVRRGALDAVDAAMMIHPADRDLTRIDAIAVQQVVATYHGEAAHAAAAPERGRNALDAAVLGYQAVAALRQHIAPAERIHGVFTDGGDKPNIVPARAETLLVRPVADRRRARGPQAAGARLPAGRRRRDRVHGDLRVGRSAVLRHARQRSDARRLVGQLCTAGSHGRGPHAAEPPWWAAPTWAT